jgi:hypothetical protein
MYQSLLLCSDIANYVLSSQYCILFVVQSVLHSIHWCFYVIICYITIIYIMLKPEILYVSPVTKTAVHFYIASLSKYDYFHIHMDFVILHRSTECK